MRVRYPLEVVAEHAEPHHLEEVEGEGEEHEGQGDPEPLVALDVGLYKINFFKKRSYNACSESDQDHLLDNRR